MGDFARDFSPGASFLGGFQSALGGGDGWAVKISAVTQGDEETTIKLHSLQNSFHPLSDTRDEVTIHVRLRGQKWLVYPAIAKLENGHLSIVYILSHNRL